MSRAARSDRRFMHETNTFSRVKTDMALIRRRDFHLENEIPQAFRGTRSKASSGLRHGIINPSHAFSSRFNFVEEAPIGVLGDDLLWGGFDKAQFMQSQRIEPHRVFGVVIAPVAGAQARYPEAALLSLPVGTHSGTASHAAAIAPTTR
jgi:hypothetical protein